MDKFDLERLRKKAEMEIGQNLPNINDMSYNDISKLLHELNVHQIELSLQNEELRIAQLEIEKQRDAFLELYDFAPVGYITIDKNEIITNVNLKCTELLNMDKFQILKMPISYIIKEDDQDIYYKHRKKTLGTKNTNCIELRLIRKENDTFYASLQSAPCFDSEGNITETRITITDISDIKIAQDEQLKQQKLESLGILAGGIAHDFNNLLTSLYGYMDLAQSTINKNSEAWGYLNNALICFERSKNLTQQLLTYAKGGIPIKKVVKILPLIEESRKIALSGSNIESNISADSDLPLCLADGGQLTQVFINLLINSRQAMPDGGVIDINVTRKKIEKFEINELNEGNYITITFSDQGVGIPIDIQKKVFDPYYSTKKNGTGLGLATSYSIIKKHEGFIKLDSQINNGTNITIFLPVTDQQLTEELPPTINEKRTGRVLIMEDEKLLNELLCSMIQKTGSKVTSVEKGEDAIIEYEKSIADNNKFDIVILDLTICGGMGGEETMKKILEIDPNAIGIVASGYSDNPIMANPKDYGFIEQLAKPFRQKELEHILNKVLK